MLNGITKARGTFFYFPPLLKTANGAAEPSFAENALVACSNTTAAPHELFDLTTATTLGPFMERSASSHTHSRVN